VWYYKKSTTKCVSCYKNIKSQVFVGVGGSSVEEHYLQAQAEGVGG